MSVGVRATLGAVAVDAGRAVVPDVEVGVRVRTHTHTPLRPVSRAGELVPGALSAAATFWQEALGLSRLQAEEEEAKLF